MQHKELWIGGKKEFVFYERLFIRQTNVYLGWKCGNQWLIVACSIFTYFMYYLMVHFTNFMLQAMIKEFTRFGPIVGIVTEESGMDFDEDRKKVFIVYTNNGKK